MSSNHKRRSLILAGGGIKVAFQAGVMQVWLDEAGLTFDHADGASGGCLNLAMYCQGMNGAAIAQNWRNLDPLAMVAFNWKEYLKLFYAESISTLDSLKDKVFPKWGLDWKIIGESKKDATFNVYNFSKQELEVIGPDRLTPDYLCACVALPMWFPPMTINGDLHIDSVYITDANIEEAIKRGADELWIIWTVSDNNEWHGGFVATYFQIIETTANGHFKRIIKRIEDNNDALAAGKHGEFGRHIEVKLLKAEVPLHYLVNLTQDRVVEAVNLGVLRARQWCAEQGITVTPTGGELPTDVHNALTTLQFTEEMKGYVSRGETDYKKGFDAGKTANDYLMFRLTIKVDGVNRFVDDPKHEAAAEGYVQCDQFGGQRPVEKGIFNLFVDQQDARRKKMLYRLFFRDGAGSPLTLSGFKDINDDRGFDVWTDTTTLFTRILKGHVNAEDEAAAEAVATGILRILMLDFLKQLTTFRTEGPTVADRIAALSKFGRLFLGKLWDVYARDLLEY